SSGLDLLHRLHGQLEAVGVDRGSQAELGVVSLSNSLVSIFGSDDRDYGSEDLFRRCDTPMLHLIKNRGFKKVAGQALRVKTLSAEYQLRSLLAQAFDLLLN